MRQIINFIGDFINHRILLVLIVAACILSGLNFSLYHENILGIHVVNVIVLIGFFLLLIFNKIVLPTDKVSLLIYSFVLIGLLNTAYKNGIGLQLIFNRDTLLYLTFAVFYLIVYQVDKYKLLDVLSRLLFYISTLFVIEFWWFLIKGYDYDTQGLFIARHHLALFLIIITGIYLQYNTVRKVDYIVILSFLITLIFCESRAAIIALIAGITTYSICRYSVYLGWKKIAFILLLGVFFVVGLLYINLESIQGRSILIEIGITMMQPSNVILGAGNGFVENYLPHYQSLYFQQQPINIGLYGGDVKTLLNEPLKLLVETGIVGLLIFILINIVCICHLYQSKSYYLLSCLVAFSVFSVFSNSFYLPTNIFLLAILYVGNNRKHNIDVNTSFRIILVLITLLSIGVQLVVVTHLYRWKKLSYYAIEQTTPGMIKEYESLQNTLWNYGYFMNDYALRLQQMEKYESVRKVLDQALILQSSLSNYLNSGYNYELLKQYDRAEQDYKMAIYVQPKLFYPKYLLFDLYREAGWSDKAINWGKEILSYPVKIAHPDVAEIKNEIENYLIQNQ